jgi:hypothetical protein
MKKTALALIAAAILTSCACGGYSVKYDGLPLNLPTIKSKNIALALLDHRDTDLDGSTNPNFVGYIRNAYGIPFPLFTESNKALIDDLSGNIISSLNKQDIKVKNISTHWKDNEKTVNSELLTLEGEKKILFVFTELNTDGYGIQFLHYKIKASIYDKDGALLGTIPFTGSIESGGSVMMGAGSFCEYMPLTMTSLLEKIFKDKEFLGAINKL